MNTLRYFLAIGGDTTLRDVDVAIACGQTDLLVSVGKPLARHLRGLPGVRVVLDSAAWPPNDPARPSFDAWWQLLRGWRQDAQDYGNLRYAIAYDTITDGARTQRDYHRLMGRMDERSTPDLPIVPVLGHGAWPDALALDALQGWAGTRDDLVNGDGGTDRPAYALGGLVPERGSARSIQWVTQVAAVLEDLIEEEGVDPALLGIHLLGTTRPAYLAPLRRLGVPVACDTSTPMLQARAGDAALAWGYTDQFGLPLALLRRSRFARVAFWLCRERSRLGLPWTTPDAAWLEELPHLTPIVLPQQLTLLAA